VDGSPGRARAALGARTSALRTAPPRRGDFGWDVPGSSSSTCPRSTATSARHRAPPRWQRHARSFPTGRRSDHPHRFRTRTGVPLPQGKAAVCSSGEPRNRARHATSGPAPLRARPELPARALA
jgi:hypothetical protein